MSHATAIPSLRAGSCQVWWAHPDAASETLLDLLDDAERRRHARFLRAEDRRRFVVAHALARIVAGRQAAVRPREIRYADGGSHAKPRFAGPAAGLEVSISHSAGRVVVALSRGVELGVDVERVAVAGDDRSLAESVLCPDELRELSVLPDPTRAWAFCRYWTRKEALLKATGHGLSVEPNRIAVTPPTRPAALVSWTGPARPQQPVYLHDLDAGAGYAASLATIGSHLERSEHDATTLLGAGR
ncbi:MAG TPA: 4'-phosphopantetheinyl transferase superfamily protein [Solirubrobacteraceae bacterium]|nr:4'-phosphopantetheinyl transferase superfamily protein [Solirubrobacteraceae bacterium]